MSETNIPIINGGESGNYSEYRDGAIKVLIADLAGSNLSA